MGAQSVLRTDTRMSKDPEDQDRMLKARSLCPCRSVTSVTVGRGPLPVRHTETSSNSDEETEAQRTSQLSSGKFESQAHAQRPRAYPGRRLSLSLTSDGMLLRGSSTVSLA